MRFKLHIIILYIIKKRIVEKVLKLVFACQINALQYIVVVVNSYDKICGAVECVVD